MKKSDVVMFVLGILLIEALAHLDIYHASMEIFQLRAPFLILALQVLLTALWPSLIAAILLSARFNHYLVWTFYQIASIWLGFLLYLFLAASLYGLLGILFNLSDLRWLGLLLFAAAILTALYGFYNGQQIKIRRLEIKLKNLPEFWRGKNVIFVSDFHLGHINREKFARRVVNQINALNPDLILIGGDLYDGLMVDTEAIIEPLKNLRSKHGVYFITGNHDGWSEIATERDLAAIEKTGIRILANQMIVIAGIQLIGVDYKDTTTKEKLIEILGSLKINPQLPSILLKHVPSHIEVAEQSGISLQLSGHTHQAQAWPLTYIPGLIYKKFAFGLNRLNQTQVYTSSGVGTWGPPMRVGTNSEIVLINFIS